MGTFIQYSATFLFVCIYLLNNYTVYCKKNINESDYKPWGPLFQCEFLSDDFLICDSPYSIANSNKTKNDTNGFGCLKFGGSKFEQVETTKVRCSVFNNIPCYGNKTFVREGIPCIKYDGHYYFVTTLLYSILLGFVGMDRFSLGQTGTAVGKLLTLGGFGIWWIIDVILLVTNNLVPDEGNSWERYK